MATRNSLILETLQRNEVQRNILQHHLNRRKRKIGVLTKSNHRPAALNLPGRQAMPIGGASHQQFGLDEDDGREYAIKANNASGRIRSRQRIVLFEDGFKGREASFRLPIESGEIQEQGCAISDRFLIRPRSRWEW